MPTVAVQAAIDFLFADPATDPAIHQRRDASMSVLYLVRREIQDCLIGTITDETLVIQQESRSRLFATMLVIMAGFDLVAKFAAGDDSREPGSIERRFRAFLEAYARPSRARSGWDRQLWRLRNELVHAFGVGDVIVNGDCPHGSWQRDPVAKRRGLWHVCIDCLYESFRQSLVAYRQDLTRDEGLRLKFAAMFPKYGSIWVSR
jgi:hypothetical protein